MSATILVVLKKILAVVLSLITPLTFGVHYEPFAKYDSQCQVVLEKTDGFMKGVCHAERDFEVLGDANIEWIREDIPFPYLSDGTLSPYYLWWPWRSSSGCPPACWIGPIPPWWRRILPPRIRIPMTGTG